MSKYKLFKSIRSLTTGKWKLPVNKGTQEMTVLAVKCHLGSYYILASLESGVLQDYVYDKVAKKFLPLTKPYHRLPEFLHEWTIFVNRKDKKIGSKLAWQ